MKRESAKETLYVLDGATINGRRHGVFMMQEAREGASGRTVVVHTAHKILTVHEM